MQNKKGGIHNFPRFLIKYNSKFEGLHFSLDNEKRSIIHEQGHIKSNLKLNMSFRNIPINAQLKNSINNRVRNDTIWTCLKLGINKIKIWSND